MIFYLHAPIKKCSKNELFSEVNFRHPAVLKASQNVNGLTNKDEFSVIVRFCEWSDLSFLILGCPYFGGYYSVLLKVLNICFTGFGT
jgi:hypothetical protein